MDDDEVERFEITDYDLENEFYPRSRRRPTKNQQIYGIWAVDSDEDEPKSKHRNAKDYSLPVNFVAGGIHQAGKKEKTDENEDEEEEKPEIVNSSSESDDEPKPSFSNADMAGFRSAQRGVGQSVGNWEKHTKGIGAKLLLQMGYQPGKGLGRALQGISAPVQAHLRKGRGAIGAYGPEKAPTIADQKANKTVEDEDKKEATNFKEKLNRWKKTGKESERPKQKTRYFYNNLGDMKAESFLSETKVKPDPIKKEFEMTKVIDMTGPKKRVLSGYHALKHSKITDEDLYEEKQHTVRNNFALPELTHNLNLIVEMFEQNIIANDKVLTKSKDKLVTLEHAHKTLQDVVTIEETHISTLERVLNIVQNIKSEDVGLDELAEQFLVLQNSYEAEYSEYELWDLAPLVVAPKINDALEGWNPLQNPKKNKNLIEQWKEILYDGRKQSGIESYSKLVWLGVVPHLRSALEEWNPKQPNSVIQFLAVWDSLFTNWVQNNIYDQLLLPRITEEVLKWDPMTDTVPIHIWIHPWASILGKRLDVAVYPAIRAKLGYALGSWHPSDRSARAVLTPWKDVFDMGEFMAFLLKYIVPKLQAALAELVINPHQQQLEQWNQVWEWKDLLSVPLMSQLLEKYFFPKWLQTLTVWLNQSPNYHQVSNWYSGWKKLLNEEMLSQTNIKEYFRKALEMMHRATGGGSSDSSAFQERVPSPPSPPTFSVDKMSIGSLGFREIVAQRCSERGILFMPMMGRRYEGKQLYKAGNLSCYIDRSVLMVSLDGVNYRPTGLADLLEKAS